MCNTVIALSISISAPFDVYIQLKGQDKGYYTNIHTHLFTIYGDDFRFLSRILGSTQELLNRVHITPPHTYAHTQCRLAFHSLSFKS